MKFYGLKNCDTCRKALKMLRESGVDVSVFDVRKDGVPEELLARAFEKFGEKLLNRRSTTWRGLSETRQKEAPIELLKATPSLMKRPLIDLNGDLFLGWDASVQKKLL